MNKYKRHILLTAYATLFVSTIVIRLYGIKLIYNQYFSVVKQKDTHVIFQQTNKLCYGSDLTALNLFWNYVYLAQEF